MKPRPLPHCAESSDLLIYLDTIIENYDMHNSVVEKKIKEKLKVHGFIESDLTQSEVDKLKEEVKAELSGETVLDGVLSNIPYYECISNREKQDETPS